MCQVSSINGTRTILLKTGVLPALNLFVENPPARASAISSEERDGPWARTNGLPAHETPRCSDSKLYKARRAGKIESKLAKQKKRTEGSAGGEVVYEQEPRAPPVSGHEPSSIRFAAMNQQ